MEHLPIWVYIAGLVILIVEYILGKTPLIKAGSIIESILNVVIKIGKAVLDAFSPKK